ncbi:TetR/AcrR family transcriptional regulator [Clostridium botulinum]|uniref:TetR/AcrR family transcriptional regulator n=1 Tax=Clostridium botulinum TaxID=1491 RepID=A0A0C2S7B5_CLOBO|nr:MULTISPECIES: TetR/AcrR family transcriptional regulator [Clostridium]KAI3350273.1 TetR/AcrR family transcriptional regulator [Clostridium botulinum]KIL08972.1 TetR family transcriptional regulator [Clostridium botulinum]KOM88117.1 TetR family transcriptional regulator [Clostridium botulinum]KOR55396.1 TetR family transcriptional regulator [Clostridium botulinum]MBN1034579.1 TetR/AcrR family transcriptional regulator [Clostridium botulinum]
MNLYDEKIDKVSAKKQLKEKQLFDSAYELFLTQGIEKTSISDIVNKAGIAKGTFYLYFNDKHDLLNKLILKKSNKLLKDAMNETTNKEIEDFSERVLFFINYIIENLKHNKLLLKIINKNISWGLYRKNILKPEEYYNVNKVVDNFIKNLVNSGMSKEEAEMTLFMIIELVGSVCFTTIIFKEPTDIDTIKPILFKKILAMIRI